MKPRYETEEIAQEIKNSLSYDSDSGILTWKWRDSKPKNVNVAFAGKRAGSLNSTGYRSIRIEGIDYKEHRITWVLKTGSWPKDQIDHINGVRDDNRWENLREATESENKRNQRKARGSSGVVGVFWEKNAKKWRSQIKPRGKIIHLGLFENKEDAVKARRAAEKEYYGEFAPK